jgi:hypothetical protein
VGVQEGGKAMLAEHQSIDHDDHVDDDHDLVLSVPVSITATWRALLAASVLLGVIGIVVDLVWLAADLDPDSTVRTFFSLDSEANLPTWWSSLLLAAAGGLALFVARRTLHPHVAAHRRLWPLLGVGLLVMSLDEAALIHEAIVGGQFESLIDDGGAFAFAWVVPGLVVVAALAIAYLRFVVTLPGASRQAFVAGAVVYVGSAIGLEMVDGIVNGDDGTLTNAKVLVAGTQELGEMVGTVLLVLGLLELLRIADAHAPNRRAARSAYSGLEARSTASATSPRATI